MKTIRYIAILSLALLGLWGNATNADGDPPKSVVSSSEAVSDTTEPADSNLTLLTDTSQPYSTVIPAFADSSEEGEETDPPANGTAKVSPLESIEDTPAGELYDDWDTTSVHSEKFDALTFDDTIRIPLNDPGHCNYVHPFNGTTTSEFGFRKYRYHFGVDINLETGDTVRCAFDGKVRIAQKSKSYGYVVVVRHNNGLETYYAHLSKLLVKPGEDIEAGMMLGLGGNTGHSFGSHLHFEVRFRGQPIDPTFLIDFKNQTLQTDTYNLTKSDFKYLTKTYKVRHYSRKKKKTYYTTYNAGGAHYATAEARSIMAKVPEPTMPGTPSTSCSAPKNPEAPKQSTQSTVVDPKTAPPQKKPATVPAKTQQTKSTTPKTQVRETIGGNPVYYVVKSGDSLYAIALRNHTTVEKLCALNGMKSTTILNVGKKLRIK